MAAQPTLIAATIAASAALSGYTPIGPRTLVGIVVPNGWTAASLSFQVSYDGGSTLFEFGNTAGLFSVTVPGTVGAFVGLDPNIWRGVTGIVVRSGTAASPVNQVSQAVLQLVTVPLL